MVRMIAAVTVVAGSESFAPGQAFEVETEAEAAHLVEIGAATLAEQEAAPGAEEQGEGGETPRRGRRS